MKKIFQTKSLVFAGIAAAIFLTIGSCQKDKSGSPAGTASPNPTGNLIRPDSGSGNTILTLEGSGLSEMRSIVFDKNNVPGTFNPNFNTDNALVFRVPDTAFGGPQNIIFTNSLGKQLIVPFRVIALASVASASQYSFSAGESITLTGNNLDNVSAVTFDVAGTAATIVSKTRKTMVITMPASTVVSTKLKITNASGTITTTQEFVNADQAFVFFRDTYHNGEQDAAWGDPGTVSPVVKVSGNSSYGKKYQKGNWHLMGFGWNGISQGSYQYLSFWMKGGLIDHEIFVNSDKSAGGIRAYNSYEKIDVKADVWQYYKIPLSTLKLWQTGTPFSQIAWSIKGPDNADETMYLDDVMLIK
ncbi:MAG: IPT/TIG domain-containing protein [Ferruginibacter sp.]|nr:IPT/TIG domain-containing protein [Chitinophagaceae bacterium]